jgi:RNA polymerase sigma factor (TIGR02999 family)
LTQTTFTRTLKAWRGGDAAAGDDLARLVYRELHRMARRLLGRERYAHSLTPTALINETWLRVFGAEARGEGAAVEIEDRRHFFLIAARQMRRLLVDRARRAKADKRIRGGDLAALGEAAGVAAGGGQPAPDLLALNEALAELERVSPRACRVVELRYFAGLSEREAAAALGVSPATLRREWRAARLWLYRRLGGDGPPGEEA